MSKEDIGKEAKCRKHWCYRELAQASPYGTGAGAGGKRDWVCKVGKDYVA